MDIKDITIEDLKEQRPDLYQEIVEECGTQPLFVREEELQVILEPLFSEFDRMATNKIANLEKELQKEIKKRMTDGFTYLTEVVERKMDKSKKYRLRTDSGGKKTETAKRRSAVIGDIIRWAPTGESGKVVRYTYSGNLRKLVLKVKQGEYIEVYDNKALYDILLEK